MAKGYSIDKKQGNNVAKIASQNIDGFKFKPKNKVKYNGVKVNEMVFINNSFIENILRRKIKNRLDLYLDYVVNLSDSDDTDGTKIEMAMNDLTRYKSIIKRKYRKYLEQRYVELLLKKIDLIEYELRMKYYSYEKEEVEEKGKSR